MVLTSGEHGQLTARQKVAAFLVAIGPENAAQVLQYLTEEEVELVAMEISRLGRIPSATTTDVLQEFHVATVAQDYTLEGGLDYARSLLIEWQGDKGAEIIDRLVANAQITSFHFLSQAAPEQLVQFLEEEHPQTVAVILAHLPTHFAANLLRGLSETLRGDVAIRIASMERTSPEIIRRVEQSLRQRLGSVTSPGLSPTRGGVEDLALLLNAADRHLEKGIFTRLEAHDKVLADRVRALMFTFDDIVTLNDKDIQEVLRSVDTKRLGLAIKGVDDGVRIAIYRNLSERAVASLQDEMDFLGAVKLKDVQAAQVEVVAIIRRLDDDGRITMRGSLDGVIA